MGYPEGHKAQTRDKIIKAAARVWKKEGYAGASVDRVMEEASLTRGGFYSHFKSKEDLLADVLTQSYVLDYAQDQRGKYSEEEIYKQIIEIYLSPEHRNHPGKGCPLSVLSAETSRMSSTTRQKIDDLINRFREWFQIKSKKNDLAVLSLMVGAITLSRAVNDPILSDQILEQARAYIKNREQS